MDDGNAMMLPPRKRKQKAMKEGVAAKPKISKNMQRKLKRIEEEKEQRKRRRLALDTLEECKLDESTQNLMWSSSKAGTMKEKLRWGLRLQRAGLPVPEDIPLARERSVDIQDDGDSMEEDIPLVKGTSITIKRDSMEEDIPLVKATSITIKDAGEMPTAGTDKPQMVRTEEPRAGFPETMLKVGTGLGLEPETQRDDPSILRGVPEVSRTTKKPSSRPPATVGLGECKKFVVRVLRSDDIEKQRSNLPIVMMEQEIMEAVHENDVVIVCGETGCGKTTQVPQFLYEAGYGSPDAKDRSGMIGVTQPRRIAVLTTAKRVAHELNLQLGKQVGFQVRHDRRIGDKSSIKFMTDGILMREIQTDFLLRKYSVIVLDEAHERSVNTDLLIGMLSRVVPLRKKLHNEQQGRKKQGVESVAPLKLIIMSATLRVEDFTENRRMFPSPPPVIHVTARQFPVKIHSSRKTELLDYETAAYKKVCAIHKRLPPGGILLFLTGRREVESMCRRLRSSFPTMTSDDVGGAPSGEKELGSVDMNTLLEGDVDAGEDDDDGDGDVDWDDDGDSESESDVSDIEETESQAVKDGDKAGRKPGPLHVLPLYAMLPAAAQLRVFSDVPEGKRLVVVATNVAETSVTIPGIRYVVDCGRAKERKFSGSSGLSKFEVSWISKASADQRAGRAGRTGPGHCYQLYSRTHYHNNFPAFAPPEISLIPIEGVALVLKCMGIEKIMNFPFPTSPEKSALVDAEKCLLALGALDQTSNSPTALGKSMVVYPVNPRHARMLLAAIESTSSIQKKSDKQLIVACAVAMAAVLSVENPFIGEEGFENKEENPGEKTAEKSVEKTAENGQVKNIGLRAAQAKFLNPASDVLTAVNALAAYEQAGDPAKFCKENFLSEKIMKEMTKLRGQLARIVSEYLPDKPSSAGWEEIWKRFAEMKLQPRHEEVLLRAVCAGWPDRIAKRMTAREKCNWQKISKRGVRYQAASMEESVYLRPTSSVFKFAADYVVYKEIVETTRPYMSCVSSISSRCMASEAAYFCTFSKPLEDPPPWYDAETDEVMCWVSATFGPQLWQLPAQAVPVKNNKQRVGTFAFALLDGRVLPGFTALRPFLAMDPSMLLKPEAIAHKRVGDLVHRLEAGGVSSKATLVKTWEGDSSFLYDEILAWLQSKHHGQLRLHWDALKAEPSLPGKQSKKLRKH